MRLGTQISYFTWPDAPASIGPTFGRIARDADAAGLDSLWVMDHFFQISMIGPAELDMLEGYTALAFAAGQTQRIQLGTLVTGVTYRHPRAPAGEDIQGRRAFRTPRRDPADRPADVAG